MDTAVKIDPTAQTIREELIQKQKARDELIQKSLAAMQGLIDAHGVEAILNVIIDITKQLANQLENSSTRSLCQCMGGDIHHLTTITLNLDSIGDCLQAGAVLKALNAARDQGWLLGKVEQDIERAKMTLLKRKGKHDHFTDRIPVLHEITMQVPLYICPKCGAFTIVGTHAEVGNES